MYDVSAYDRLDKAMREATESIRLFAEQIRRSKFRKPLIHNGRKMK